MDTNAEANDLQLHHDAWGRLVLRMDGREHVGVVPVRAFPLSDPANGLAICDADGRELLWIDELASLPGPVRAVLEGELARREFVPVICHIIRASAVEPSEWEVDTDRGRTTFLLEGEDDVHPLDGHRALLTDANGLRYLIPDVRALDAHSRRLLERYL
jgi:hypothetical protein